jgi:thiol-disulfide isomerase/thioredoxin
MSLEALKGNIVVLDFWTYCCINCLHVLPELAAIEAEFSGDPVAVIGVHAAKFPAESVRENVERAVERHRVQHPVVLDPDHRLWEAYAVRSWPTVMILDATGRIAWQKSGEVDRSTLSATIRRLLEEAREDDTLADPVWQVPAAEAAPDLRALRHPEKLMVWPGPLVQTARKADPFGLHSRLYLSDTGNHRIIELRLTREVGSWPRAKVVRIFGDGTPGLEDGVEKAARFRGPRGLARTQNTLWVADTENHAIRAIDLNSGAVRTVAGNGKRAEGIDKNPDDPRKVSLRSPWDLEAIVNSDGEPVIFIAMAGTHQIWLLFPSRRHIGPFVGSGIEEHIDGPPQQAALAQPSGMVLAGDYLFFVDSETSSVRAYRMDERQLGTLSGQGLFDFGDVDGQGAAVRMQHPLGITIGESELYIADTFNNKIKTLQVSSGAVATLADGLSEPSGLCRAGDFLIVADTNHHRIAAVHRRTGVVRDIPIVW